MAVEIIRKINYSVIAIIGFSTTGKYNQDKYLCDNCSDYETEQFDALVVHLRSNCKSKATKLGNSKFRNKLSWRLSN